MGKQICIAIDGPAGAGKSTVAKKVAETLGFLYIDTGAMYRAVAYGALLAGIPFERKELADFAETQDISLKNEKVYLNEKDITAEIRRPEVNSAVSTVAAIPEVRELLVTKQREMAQRGGVVMDGRDIGTHVLPEAELKVFLTASLEERVERRYQELIEKGFRVEKDGLLNEVSARDYFDSHREVSPLQKAQDAFLIDTTGLTVAEVVEKIVRMARGIQACSTG